MLTSPKALSTASDSVPGRFAVVASTYNRLYVDRLLRHARRELRAARARRVDVIRVPGAFEIPAVAAALAAQDSPPAVIICLGVIFQGETAHARQIGDAVTQALAELQIRYRIPVIDGVYLFTTPEQARVRCLGTAHNRGIEVGRTAVEMARVMERLGRATTTRLPRRGR
jgi:6,7-dimethyl-8-ribityllumazine synthase